MEVTVAKTAGFCFGVERAIEMAEAQAKKSEGPVYTLGPLVHNEAVIRDLEAQGVYAVSEEELLQKGSGTAIIRAHGTTKACEERLKIAGFQLYDATCPFVQKIHRIVREHSLSGETILIAGDPSHPEVRGIIGWCEGPAFVVENPEDLNALPLEKNSKVCLVAQTTFNYVKFKIIVEKIKSLVYNATIADTICNATRERQEEAGELASASDVMLVIGSPSSSNSRKLYDICKQQCSHTFFIQSMADLNKEWFHGVKSVGITAGASTPSKIILEVQTNVRKF